MALTGDPNRRLGVAQINSVEIDLGGTVVLKALELEEVRMSHVVVIQVKIDSDSDREHRHSILNDFVLPQARALPGFENGLWMNDGIGTGMCVVVFDTKENAENAVGPLTPDGGPPVIACGVHTVEAEA